LSAIAHGVENEHVCVCVCVCVCIGWRMSMCMTILIGGCDNEDATSSSDEHVSKECPKVRKIAHKVRAEGDLQVPLA